MYVKKNMTLLRCPIEKGLDMLGGKWKSRILCVLAQRGPIRYGHFKQEMTNVTDTALSGALKELIRDGLVDRKQYNEVPLRVEYELTPLWSGSGAAAASDCGLGRWFHSHRALPG